jgi:hypothetical protein
LLRATKFTHAKIAIILRNQTTKTGPRNKIHDLRKQRSAKVHGGAPDRKKIGKITADSSNGVQIDTKEISINLLNKNGNSGYDPHLTGQQ